MWFFSQTKYHSNRCSVQNNSVDNSNRFILEENYLGTRERFTTSAWKKCVERHVKILAMSFYVDNAAWKAIKYDFLSDNKA